MHQMCVTVPQDMWVTTVRQVSFNAFGQLYSQALNLRCFSLAVCVPECQNGGTCSAPNVCDCSAGYIGEQCQIGVFQIIFTFYRDDFNLHIFLVQLYVTQSVRMEALVVNQTHVTAMVQDMGVTTVK